MCRWAFVELLPAFALVALGVVYVSVLLYKLWCLNSRKKGNLHGHLPQLISCVTVMFRVLYIYITRMSLDVFNCLPTTPPDGNTYMSGLIQ
jgi:amino acid permease